MCYCVVGPVSKNSYSLWPAIILLVYTLFLRYFLDIERKGKKRPHQEVEDSITESAQSEEPTNTRSMSKRGQSESKLSSSQGKQRISQVLNQLITHLKRTVDTLTYTVFTLGQHFYKPDNLSLSGSPSPVTWEGAVRNTDSTNGQQFRVSCMM